MRRYTTVERVVDDAPYEPSEATLVGGKVRVDEPVLRGRVRAAGGVWNAGQSVYELPYGAVVAPALEDRAQPLDVAMSGQSSGRMSTSGQNRLYSDTSRSRGLSS